MHNVRVQACTSIYCNASIVPGTACHGMVPRSLGIVDDEKGAGYADLPPQNLRSLRKKQSPQRYDDGYIVSVLDTKVCDDGTSVAYPFWSRSQIWTRSIKEQHSFRLTLRYLGLHSLPQPEPNCFKIILDCAGGMGLGVIAVLCDNPLHNSMDGWAILSIDCRCHMDLKGSGRTNQHVCL